MKQNDYFLNQLYNPEFSPEDFNSVGLNSDNTSIEDKKIYKDLDIVQNNPMFQTENKFDEEKFNKFYNQALVGFNIMSDKDNNERLASSYSAFRDDIFSKSSNKQKGAETWTVKIANPNKQTIGFVSSNIMEAPTQSVREIAQAQLVWDGEKWVDSPNDQWLKNFIDPKVLAQWDFDADENGNPTNDKSKIVYHKGEKKINPLTGTYYYETLNGRSIYGRDVLSGWDTLTVDGSPINKYDFFDSDDLQKSFGGSMVKAAVKIAPALIPTVSPWYIGARVILETSDLLGKILKMATVESDNSFASWLEGFNQATTMSSSDFARGSSELGIEAHPWHYENLLDLGANVFTQLAEQRWLFTHAPSLLSGTKLGFSEEAQKEFKNGVVQKLLNGVKKGEITGGDLIDIKTASMFEAQAVLDSKLKSINKLGEYLSKLYMTGIVAGDSFGEAKEAGLSDIEAALFTLGYGAAEYKLLSTGIGEHILPELRAEKTRMRTMLSKAAGVAEKEKVDTRKWYKKLLSFGANSVTRNQNDKLVGQALKSNSPYKAFAISAATNAFGEGVEEVSEEFLLDMSKLLYNAAANLGITSTGKTMETFDGGNLSAVMNRYAQNFVGGLIGGGIAVGLPGFQQGIKNMLGTNMTDTQAYQELVAIIRNGGKEDLLRTLDKMELANSNLSATEYENVDGKAVYKQGTKENNQDKAAKDVMRQRIELIDSLLKSNGANIDDSSILKHLIGARDLIKFQTILGGDNPGSSILASYNQHYNTLTTDIAKTAEQIWQLENPTSDQAKKLTDSEQQTLSQLKSKLAKLKDQHTKYLNGDMSKIVLPKVLFELEQAISFPYIATDFKSYVEKVENRVLSEVPEQRLNELKEEWENYKQGGYVDTLETMYAYFKLINEKYSETLKQYNLNYFENPQDFQQNLGNIFLNTETLLANNAQNAEDFISNTSSYNQNEGISRNPRIQANIQVLGSLIATLQEKFGGYNEELNAYLFLNSLPSTVEVLKLLGNYEEVVNNLKTLSRNTFDPDAENAQQTYNKLKQQSFQALITDVLQNEKNSDNIKTVLSEISYMNDSVKNFLITSFFKQMAFDENGQDIVEIYDEDDPEYERISSLQSEFSNVIRGKQNSPIEELADKFQLTIGDESMPISQLIRTLQAEVNNLSNRSKLEQFSFSKGIQQQLTHALKVINLLTSHIQASRSDGAKTGAIFGFNATMNELLPESNLVTINNDVANTLLMDLAKLQSKLEHFQTIVNVNTGQKLAEHEFIGSRISYNFIKRAKVLVGVIPEKWEGKDELERTFQDLPTYEELEKLEDEVKYNITPEKRNSLDKESIKVQDALYDFFQKNIKLIEEGELSTLISRFKLLPSILEESKSFDGTLIDSNLNDFDDRSFWAILASVASVKASDFYSLYKQSFDPKFAPVPGQELAIKMAFSFLVNQPLFEHFGKAYNQKILSETENVDGQQFWDNYGKVISKDSKLDSSYGLQFVHTFLVEGIPGAGKSTGYYTVLINMLKNHPSLSHLLKNIWIIHTDADKAKVLGLKIGLNENQITGHSVQDYIKKIRANYVSPSYTSGGSIIESKENLEEDTETGISHWKDEDINQLETPPTLIIFDESTRFSQQEMLLSEKFQTNLGIHGLATGDYDQIGAQGTIDLGEGEKIHLSTYADNFFHSPKLGTSMRTDNKIKDLNISSFRVSMQELIKRLRTGQQVDKVDLKYYEGEEGIFGEKIVTDYVDSINLMLKTLKEGEKINFIYGSKDSEIYKYLTDLNEKFEDSRGKINFVEAGAAQGEEAQYYIVDMPKFDITTETTGKNIGDHQQFIRTFYTAISRSQQGTLIIGEPNVNAIVTNTKTGELLRSTLGEQGILIYTEKKQQLFDTINGNPENIHPVSIASKKTSIHREKPLPENPKIDVEDEGTEETVSKLNSRRVDVKNDTESEYNILLHSMPVQETGFERKTINGVETYVPSVGFDKRIDGLNGLLKLSTTEIDKDSEGNPIYLTDKPRTFTLPQDGIQSGAAILNILNEIRQAGLYLDDKEEIKRRIKNALGLQLNDDEFGVDFLFMVKDTDPDYYDEKIRGGFGRLIKSLKEKLLGVFKGSKQEAIQNKYFALNVYRVQKGENGAARRINFLTVPVSIFTSPLTMLQTDAFKPLAQIFETRANKDMNRMIDLIENDSSVASLPNAQKLLKSLKIYTYKNKNGDAVVYLDDDFTIAGKSKVISGPTITVKDNKGFDYYFSPEYKYAGTYINISEIDQNAHHLSKKVYYSPEDVLDKNGNVLIQKGHRFVLISDLQKYDNDQEMFEDFLNEKPWVSRVYVSSPKVNITEYFQNFTLLYKGHSSSDELTASINTDIGNELSDFRIAEAITKSNSPFDQLIRSQVSQDSNNKTLTLLKWEIFKNIVQQISQKLENASSQEKVDLMNQKLSESEYLDLIKAPDNISDEEKNAINALRGAYSRYGTIKQFISGQLLNFVIKNNNGYLGTIPRTNDGNLQLTDTVKTNLSKVEESLPDKMKEGIFVKMGRTSGNSVSAGNYQFVEISTEANYTYSVLEGQPPKPIRTNGKIDSTMHVMEVNSLMDTIIDVLENKDGRTKSKMLSWYIGDHRPHTSNITPSNSIPEEISNKWVLIKSLMTLNKEAFKDVELTDENILKTLNSLGFVVYQKSGKYYPILYKKGVQQILPFNIFKINNEYKVIKQNGTIEKVTSENIKDVIPASYFKNLDFLELNDNLNENEKQFLEEFVNQVKKQNQGDLDQISLQDFVKKVNVAFTEDELEALKIAGFDLNNLESDIEYFLQEAPTEEGFLFYTYGEETLNNFNNSDLDEGFKQKFLDMFEGIRLKITMSETFEKESNSCPF